LARLPSGLRLQRLARGLTLKELAERTDLSEATLSRLERGLARVREDVAKKLDRIHGVSERQR
jgi:transcriptional regulator with XRE-family HTH domain